MKFIAAPWRWSFISQISQKKKCVFCQAQQQDDDASLICYRGQKFFVILNKYPYSTGHVMVAPYSHLSSPEEISSQETLELWELLTMVLGVLKKEFHAQGFNVGMNIGGAAGAGIEDHFHLHVVPRWKGDANFMALIGDTRVLSYDLKEVFQVLRDSIERSKTI